MSEGRRFCHLLERLSVLDLLHTNAAPEWIGSLCCFQLALLVAW
jgi:hypothetical protein